jgi:hypothetical protein
MQYALQNEICGKALHTQSTGRTAPNTKRKNGIVEGDKQLKTQAFSLCSRPSYPLLQRFSGLSALAERTPHLSRTPPKKSRGVRRGEPGRPGSGPFFLVE